MIVLLQCPRGIDDSLAKGLKADYASNCIANEAFEFTTQSLETYITNLQSDMHEAAKV